MKPLILTIALLFSTPAWAKWELVATVPAGEIFIDFNNVRINDGYVYHWQLSSWKKPIMGNRSIKLYYKCDCSVGRRMVLQAHTYFEPMGKGSLKETLSYDDEKWEYPPPDSGNAIALSTICSVIEILKNPPPSRN